MLHSSHEEACSVSGWGWVGKKGEMESKRARRDREGARKHEKESETATEYETGIDRLSSCCATSRLICWRVSCGELAWGPESESHIEPLPPYPSRLPEDLKRKIERQQQETGRGTGISIMSVLIATQQIDTAASSNMVRNFQWWAVLCYLSRETNSLPRALYLIRISEDIRWQWIYNLILKSEGNRTVIAVHKVIMRSAPQTEYHLSSRWIAKACKIYGMLICCSQWFWTEKLSSC